MAIKDLLVAYDGNEGSKNALRFAVMMANKYEAAITGVHIFRLQTYESHIRRWTPEDVLERMRESELEAEKEIEASYRSEISATGFAGEVKWISAQGRPNVVLPRLSRYFDITVLGQFTNAFEHERGSLQPEEVLRRSGSPLIIVPLAYQVRPLKETAAVAWDGSRSAARAMRDAMQILETKNQLDVLFVGKDGDDARMMITPEHDIIEHLKLHGIKASKVLLQADNRNYGDVILEHCAETAPDILVIGAYGRGRFGGVLFGSLTRHMITHMTVPLLLSH